jgi:hypothetical protein
MAGDTRLEFVVTATSVDAAQAVANNLARDTLNRRALPPAARARRRGPGNAAWEARLDWCGALRSRLAQGA